MTRTPITFPDTELWATDWCRRALVGRSEPYAADVYVSNRVPDTRRDRMVIFRRDGGVRLDQVREQPRLTLRIWGPTEQEATDLARLVLALLWAAPDGAPLCAVPSISGPSPVADESGQPLRLASADLIIRGTELDGPDGPDGLDASVPPAPLAT